MNELSASDIALMTDRNNNGWGSDGMGFVWIFALLMLANGGFGGWGNNGFANAVGYENLATSNEVQRGFDNQNQMANQREILSAVTNGTAQSVAATNQTFHDTLSVITDKYDELQRDIAANAVSIANLQANQNQCCCDIKMEIERAAAATDAQIAQNRFEAAMNTASINANTTAQVQRLYDLVQQNKIESLQAQVSDLQLQNQLNGVVRYPNSWAYNAGTSPFCTCQQCCNM